MARIICGPSLHHAFDNFLVADLYRFHAALFVPVKTETHEVALLGMVKIGMARDLILTASVVRIPTPYLEFDNILISEVVDDDIRPCLIAGLALDIIIADAVDDGF